MRAPALFSSLYDPVLDLPESLGLRRLREDALRGLAGRVLELGIGTGRNVEVAPVLVLQALYPADRGYPGFQEAILAALEARKRPERRASIPLRPAARPEGGTYQWHSYGHVPAPPPMYHSYHTCPTQRESAAPRSARGDAWVIGPGLSGVSENPPCETVWKIGIVLS